MLKLNRPQRLLLLGGAAVVGFLLFAQISDVGLEEANWLVGSLVILGLLMLAAAGSGAPGVSAQPSSKPALQESEGTLPVVLDTALVDAKAHFSERFKELFSKKAAPPGITIETSLPIGPTTDPIAWKAAFMIVLLSFAKKVRGFEESGDASKLAAKTAVEIASSTNRMRAALAGEKWSISELKQDEMQTYLKEVVECRLRVVRTMRQLAQNSEFPLDPIFSLIAREFPFGGSTPSEREEAYGPIARNLMRDLTR
jgi:hypothetical protein